MVIHLIPILLEGGKRRKGMKTESVTPNVNFSLPHQRQHGYVRLSRDGDAEDEADEVGALL